MVSCGISTSFPVLFPTERKVAHALLTRPPLKQFIASYNLSPLDLHVLGTPPAFVLSQDQTLSFNPLCLTGLPAKFNSFGITVSCLRYSCSVSFSRFSAEPLSVARSRVSLSILSKIRRIVNTLFEIFQLIFHLPVFPDLLFRNHFHHSDSRHLPGSAHRHRSPGEAASPLPSADCRATIGASQYTGGWPCAKTRF